MENNKDESVLINPDDIKKSTRKRVDSEVKENTNNVVDIVKQEVSITPTFNRSGQIKINFESEGRFSLPETMWFKDFTSRDINNFQISEPEELFETLINCLNNSKNEDSKVDIQEASLEELFEVLLGINIKFGKGSIDHQWVCECQFSKPEESMITNSTFINLSELDFKSISEADKCLQDEYRELFISLTDNEWTNYLQTKYGDSVDVSNITREDEIQKIKIEEPFKIRVKEDIVSFRLSRVKDIIDAQKMSQRKHSQRIIQVQRSKPTHNQKLADFKYRQEEKIKKIKKEESADMLQYIKALSILDVNGKTLTKEEKINYFENIPRVYFSEIENLLDKAKFGVVHEQEFTCPMCGKVDKRLLRQDLYLHELLPIGDNTNNASRRDTRLNIYFGV